MREAKAATVLPEWSSSLLLRAQEFKAKVAQHAMKLHLDYLNPTIVWERPSYYSASSQTMLEFCKPAVASRYNIYWAVTILANKILLALGEDDESLVQEYQDAAEDICRSLDYVHSMQPLGALWLTFAASMAYGVSGGVNRQRIVEGIRGTYQPIPIKDCPTVLQNCFNLLTGGVYIH